MAYRTPPFITPVALVSMILALSAGNAVVNVSTKTHNGAPRSSQSVTSSGSEEQQSNTESTSQSTTDSQSVSESGQHSQHESSQQASSEKTNDQTDDQKQSTKQGDDNQDHD